MQKIITPLPIQLGSKTAGTNTLGLYLDPNKALGGNPNPVDGTAITTAANAWGDLSSNNSIAYQGTAASQPLFKTGIDNGNPMILFDGTDDALTVDSAATIDNLFSGGGFALFVIKPTGVGGASQGRLFSQSGGNNYMYLSDESGGTCKISFYMSFSTTSGEWVTNSRVINLNQVNIVAISYNNSNVANDPIFYINGKSPTPITETSTPVGTAGTASTIRIGNNATTSRSYAGYMGDIAMFKTVLNGMQIVNLIEFFAKKYNKSYSLPVPLAIQGGGVLNWIKFSDTSTITASGSDIVSVYNKSGNGNNASQSVSGNRPKTGLATLNSLNVASFTAASTHLLNFLYNTPVNVPFTIFIVGQSNNTANIQNFIGRRFGNTAGEFVVRREANGGVFNSFGYGSGGLASQASRPSDNNANIHTVTLGDNIALTYSTNNAAASVGTARVGYNNTLTTTLSIGASNSTGSLPLDGYIAEIITFDRILSAEETNLVNQYLSTEYNIAI